MESVATRPRTSCRFLGFARNDTSLRGRASRVGVKGPCNNTQSPGCSPDPHRMKLDLSVCFSDNADSRRLILRNTATEVERPPERVVSS
jgi:hypothetical protein